MCHVAAEMERQGFELPLLIGGATTSRVHTAVKIHPNYRRGQTVYVTDASRAVGVASGAAVGASARPDYVADMRGEYAKIAAAHARARRTTSSGCRSRRRAPTRSSSTGRAYVPPKPTFLGTHDARRLSDRRAGRATSTGRRSSRPGSWPGKFPAILDDDKVGEAARALYDDAQAMLEQDRRREAGSRPAP